MTRDGISARAWRILIRSRNSGSSTMLKGCRRRAIHRTMSIRTFSRVYVDPLAKVVSIKSCCGRKSSFGEQVLTWALRFPVELIPLFCVRSPLHLYAVKDMSVNVIGSQITTHTLSTYIGILDILYPATFPSSVFRPL